MRKTPCGACWSDNASRPPRTTASTARWSNTVRQRTRHNISWLVFFIELDICHLLQRGVWRGASAFPPERHVVPRSFSPRRREWVSIHNSLHGSCVRHSAGRWVQLSHMTCPSSGSMGHNLDAVVMCMRLCLVCVFLTLFVFFCTSKAILLSLLLSTPLISVA